MDEKLREQIIDRIVNEVLYKIQELEPKDVVPGDTVVLVSSFIPSFSKADELIRERFGGEITYVDFSGYTFPDKLEKVVSAEEEGNDGVITLVSGAANVVLLTPRLKLLNSIAEGEDEGFIEFLIIRSLLWGRRVSVILDFEPPSFKRNTFFEKVAGVADILEEIGIELASYDCAHEQSCAKALITEADVVDEWKKGHRELLSAVGGIVTPSARDKARELNIKIN